jgi:hypothetical protein
MYRYPLSKDRSLFHRSKGVDDQLGWPTLRLLCCSMSVRLLSIDLVDGWQGRLHGDQRNGLGGPIGPGRSPDEEQTMSSRLTSIDGMARMGW